VSRSAGLTIDGDVCGSRSAGLTIDGGVCGSRSAGLIIDGDVCGSRSAGLKIDGGVCGSRSAGLTIDGGVCGSRSAGLTIDGGATGNSNVQRQVTCPPGEMAISDMALNSTGEIMYSAAGNTVRIWDLRTYALYTFVILQHYGCADDFSELFQ